METNAILHANLLDIVFEGRNKNYGAYVLRSTYDKRLGKSLLAMLSVVLLLAVAASVKQKEEKKQTTFLFDPAHPVNFEKEIIPPPPKVKQHAVKTVTDTKPVLVKETVKPPPTMIEILNSVPGVATTEGPTVINTSLPETIPNSKTIEQPSKVKEQNNEPVVEVQIPASFNGNWTSYVKKEIEKNIDELTDEGVSGTCIVQFIVSTDGSISNVEALTMKGTKLAEVAVNAIRKGPKWIPAQNNGVAVKAYRQQPVTFRIE